MHMVYVIRHLARSIILVRSLYKGGYSHLNVETYMVHQKSVKLVCAGVYYMWMAIQFTSLKSVSLRSDTSHNLLWRRRMGLGWHGTSRMGRSCALSMLCTVLDHLMMMGNPWGKMMITLWQVWWLGMNWCDDDGARLLCFSMLKKAKARNNLMPGPSTPRLVTSSYSWLRGGRMGCQWRGGVHIDMPTDHSKKVAG